MAEPGGGISSGTPGDRGRPGRLRAVVDAAHREAARCRDGARDARGAGNDRGGREADEAGRAGRRPASRPARGPGGDRRCRGGAGGGSGAPLPPVVGGVPAVHRSAAPGRSRRGRRPRSWPLGAAAPPEPAGCPADRRRRHPHRGTALPGRSAAAYAGGRGGPLAAAADLHAAGRAGHLLRRHDDRDGAGQRLCLVTRRARVLLRARAVQAGARAAGQRRGVGWGDDGGLQRRGGLCGAGQSEGRAGLCHGARQPAAVGVPREPAAVRRPRPAGTPLRHRRRHPRADRGGHGGAGGRPADPYLRPGSTASRSTRPAGRSWPWPSWTAPARSSGPTCC